MSLSALFSDNNINIIHINESNYRLFINEKKYIDIEIILDNNTDSYIIKILNSEKNDANTHMFAKTIMNNVMRTNNARNKKIELIKKIKELITVYSIIL